MNGWVKHGGSYTGQILQNLLTLLLISFVNNNNNNKSLKGVCTEDERVLHPCSLVLQSFARLR